MSLITISTSDPSYGPPLLIRFLINSSAFVNLLMGHHTRRRKHAWAQCPRSLFAPSQRRSWDIEIGSIHRTLSRKRTSLSRNHPPGEGEALRRRTVLAQAGAQGQRQTESADGYRELVKMAKQFLSSPPALLTLLGAIIAAIGVFWASVRNAASQREIIRLNHQVTEKSDQIAKLNEQIVDLVTGGDSFIYLDCIPQPNSPFVVLIHKRGEFPLYDVTVRIVDLNSKPLGLGTQWALGNYPRGTAEYTAEQLSLPRHGEEASFSFFFIARNGAWYENLRLTLVNGNWKSALQVYAPLASGKRKDLYKHIDDGFPTEADGSVKWQG
jgi:cell division protein FtsL